MKFFKDLQNKYGKKKVLIGFFVVFFLLALMLTFGTDVQTPFNN